jgi:hypothetical protein
VHSAGILILEKPIRYCFKLVAQPYLASLKAKEMIDFENQNVVIHYLLMTTRHEKTSQGKLMRLKWIYHSRSIRKNIVI